MENNILVIGIAGGTGSGKTTLMKNIINRFGDVVTVLSHDNYYKRHDDMTYEERCALNYDEPASLETDLMTRHLEALRRGEAIDCPVYDFTVHNRSDETIRITPSQVIIVEGILIFADEALRELMDIRIFVIPMPMCVYAAGSSGTSTSGAGLWKAYCCSISRR